MITNLIVAFCAAALSVMCVVLVLDKDYEDGLIGRVSLAFMSLAGYGRAVTLIESDFTLQLSWIAVMIWLSITAFVARHIYRFIRWRNCGEHQWRKSTKMRRLNP